MMTPFLRRSAFAATALTAMLMAGPIAGSAQAQSLTPAQRGEVEGIIKEYIIKHPEILEEAMRELEKRQVSAAAEKAREALKTHSEMLFNSPHQVTLGNPKGDVTLVEFFDYNCGYCKRALGDMLTLLKSDPNLRVVLKEFPVLGQGSVEASQVAIAVNMQDKSGKKYLDFHQRLLSVRGQADRARALAAAKEAGVDMTRLEKDMTSPEVRTTLQETATLVEALGMNGTPSYVVGDEILIGAVGLDALREKINSARCGKPVC